MTWLIPQTVVDLVMADLARLFHIVVFAVWYCGSLNLLMSVIAAIVSRLHKLVIVNLILSIESELHTPAVQLLPTGLYLINWHMSTLISSPTLCCILYSLQFCALHNMHCISLKVQTANLNTFNDRYVQCASSQCM